MMRITKYVLPGLIIVVCINTMVQAQKIKATYSQAAYQGTFSGKVILYLSKECKTPKELDEGVPFSCFSIMVNGIEPNTSVLFDDAAIAYPVMLSDIERGEYYAQVVWDRNTGGRKIGDSPDNMYNEPVKINLTKNIQEIFSVNCTSKIPIPGFKETEYLKELKVPSNLLTSFYSRTTSINGAVILPAEYYIDSTRLFPVLYEINGYGGSGYYGY